MELQGLTYASTLHVLSKRLISEVGAPAADLLGTLCHRQIGANDAKQYKNFRNGKYWFFCPLGRRATGKKAQSKNYRPLQDQCGWTTKTALHSLVHKLKGKNKDRKVYVELHNWNENNNDKTSWYHVPENIIRRGFFIKQEDGRTKLVVRQQDSVYFSTLDVAQHGTIPRAIVKNIILREFHLVGRKRQDTFTLAFNRNAIARETGLPLSTVSDAFRYFATAEVKTLATTDGGKSYRLLVPNPITDDILKSRGKGRKTVCAVIGIEGSYSSNPFPMTIVKFPDNGLRELTAKSLAQVAALRPEKPKKPKKVHKRRRGKQPVVCDDILLMHGTKRDDEFEKEWAKEIKSQGGIRKVKAAHRLNDAVLFQELKRSGNLARLCPSFNP